MKEPLTRLVIHQFRSIAVAKTYTSKIPQSSAVDFESRRVEYIGGCNVGRDTTIVRSGYLLDGNTQFYDFFAEVMGGLIAAAQLQ